MDIGPTKKRPMDFSIERFFIVLYRLQTLDILVCLNRRFSA